MADWVPIAKWHDCASMVRPGIIFELRNADGESLFSPCSQNLPTTPFDWKSPPTEFRPVMAEKPHRSGPMPKVAPRD
jgi:hypothetical protein